MNVLHFVGTFIPQYNGTTTRLMNLLGDDGNGHRLVVPEIETTDDLPTSYKNINIYRMNKERMMGILHIPLKDTDIVHAHNPLFYARLSHEYAKKHNIPMIYEIHRLIYEVEKDGVWTHLPNRMYEMFLKNIQRHDKKIIDHSKTIIAHSPAQRYKLIQMFNLNPNKVVLIPNGIRKEFFKTKDHEKQVTKFKEDLGWTDKTIFMYAGALEERNGIDFFLECIRRLPKQYHKKIIIMILGRGPLAEYIMELSEKYDFIYYLGMKPYDMIPFYYAISDVAVIPSMPVPTLESGASLKLLEAMASGKIILVSDTNGNKDFINEERGILFKKGDKEDLQRRIVEILINKEWAKNKGLSAQQRVKKLTWENQQKKLREIYENVSK